jgi:hypothetical protein
MRPGTASSRPGGRPPRQSGRGWVSADAGVTAVAMPAVAGDPAGRNGGELGVKLAPRAVITALITTTAAVAVLLPFSVPALASPVPPAPNPGLIRTWANTNPATRNVVDIVISRSRNGIAVDGFGACSPTPCQWGNIPGTLFGTSVSSATGNSFEANWRFADRTAVLACRRAPLPGECSTSAAAPDTCSVWWPGSGPRLASWRASIPPYP